MDMLQTESWRFLLICDLRFKVNKTKININKILYPLGCKILTYKEIDRSQWGRLVRESRTGTWFQSPEAYMLFASMPEIFQPFSIAVERVNELTSERTLRGVCVGYVTREKSWLKQYFTRRAIILGGPVLSDDASSEEVEALMRAVKGYGLQVTGKPIYVETRNFEDYSKWKGAFEAAGFEYKKHLNYHVDCTDEEAMWERLSENRKRQIRKGERLSVIGDGLQEEDIRKWYGILERLYRTKVKTPLWPVEFFLEAYRQGVGKFLLVKHEGNVIGGSMVVCKGLPVTGDGLRDENGCVYEWFECGMNAEYKEQYPSVMATWAGMEFAHKNGCARYDMMGAGEPGVPYGVRDFKSEFGGELVEQGRFLYVQKPVLYGLGKFVVKILKNIRI